MLFGVPQGFILDPFFFLMNLCDLFYFEVYVDIASYAYDNTPYRANSNIENTVSSLESYFAQLLFNWLQQNAMNANPE